MKLIKPTINILKKYISHFVYVTFLDGSVIYGTLGYTEEFSLKYDYRKPFYFTVNDIDFKVSHIKSVLVVLSV